MNVSGIALPLPVGGAAMAADPTSGRAPRAPIRDAIVRGVNVLAAATAGGASRALQSALEKLRSASSAIAECDNLTDGIAALLAQQAKQSDQRIGLALAQVKNKQEQMKAQNLAEKVQIEKRLEAAKSSNIWSSLINLFKAIGAALSAASSIFTGPAGMVGAGLLVASLVVSLAKPDDWGKWLSLALSLAAVAVGGAAAIYNVVTAGSAAASATATGVSEGVKTGVQVGAAAGGGTAGATANAANAGVKLGLQGSAAASEALAGGCTIAKGVHNKQGLDAQAALAELKALRQQLQAEADEARDEVELVVEAQTRCVKAALRIFESQQGATMRALGR